MKPPSHLVPQTAAARARAAGRLRVAFGPRFFILLFLGFVWLGPAWWEPRFLFGFAAWDVFVLFLWAWDMRRLPVPEQLEVRRVWTAPAALVTKSRVALELVNHSRESVLASAVDYVPVTLRSEPPVLELAAPVGGIARALYDILPNSRGDVALGNVFLRYQSRLRVAERWAEAPLSQTIRIYPDLERSKRATLFLIRSRQVQLERRLRRHRGRGREFESLREARDGDEWRDISWTASARRGKLITKIYQVERSQVVWLVLDAGRLLRARVTGLSKLDYSVTAALSLAQVALHSGDRVGLLAYGRKTQQLIKPGRGAPHLRVLIEALAQVTSEAPEADHLRAGQTLLSYQTGRSLVVWLTDLAETAATPEVIETAMQLTPPHLVLFSVISQPELRRLSERRPENVTEMYRYVTGQEVLQRRDLLLRGLRQRGSLAVELEPERLSLSLVNQYLDIKERSLL